MKNTFINKQIEDFKTSHFTISFIKPSNNFWCTRFVTIPIHNIK